MIKQTPRECQMDNYLILNTLCIDQWRRTVRMRYNGCSILGATQVLGTKVTFPGLPLAPSEPGCPSKPLTPLLPDGLPSPPLPPWPPCPPLPPAPPAPGILSALIIFRKGAAEGECVRMIFPPLKPLSPSPPLSPSVPLPPLPPGPC